MEEAKKTFFYDEIDDPKLRGQAIHSEIQKYIREQDCQLSDPIRQIVDYSIAAALKFVKKGEMLIGQWKSAGCRKKIEWAFIGEKKYVIIDWKTGKTKNDFYLEQVKNYSCLYQNQQIRGQIWIINVDKRQITKFIASQFSSTKQGGQQKEATDQSITKKKEKGSREESKEIEKEEKIGQYQLIGGKFWGRKLKQLPQWYKYTLIKYNAIQKFKSSEDRQHLIKFLKIKQG